MTHDDVTRTMAEMERLRMDSYEANTEKEHKDLLDRYQLLWHVVRPYIEGEKSYSDANA